jgi:hypothetical protein
MAGLLDIFGTGGTETLSLLGMSPAEIQRNRDDAQAQALYGLAARLFQGGNTGQSIAEGLQQGQKLYSAAMQNQLQDQLQGFQLKDLLRKRKQEEEATARQAMIDRAVAGAYRPAVAAVEPPTPTGPLSGAAFGEVGTPAQAAGFDIESLAPALMATPQGRKTLGELMAAQKAMAGELTNLAEGATLVRINPLTNKQEVVATGAPKQEAMPTSLREFMAAQQNPEFAKFLTQQKAASAPKIAVDLKDPTAVAKAQSEVVKDWRGVVKDTGAMEVADRFKAAKAAVQQGNAGNKAADGALIYAIGKIYDPSGAVQEGDKQTILGNRSIPDSIKAYAQKAFSGQDLLPAERAGLLSVATQIVQSKAKNLETQKSPYTSISRQLGGSGDLLLNPLADVLAEGGGGDLASQAAAILAKRKNEKAK